MTKTRVHPDFTESIVTQLAPPSPTDQIVNTLPNARRKALKLRTQKLIDANANPAIIARFVISDALSELGVKAVSTNATARETEVLSVTPEQANF